VFLTLYPIAGADRRANRFGDELTPLLRGAGTGLFVARKSLKL
jgi:hypothetical protein